MIAVDHVDRELRDETERVRRCRRESPQDALLAIRREADRQGLDAERPDGDHDQRRHEHVDEAQAAEGGIRRCGPKIEPKISRMTVGRAMAASQEIGSRNSSFASVSDQARISFMTAPSRCWADRRPVRAMNASSRFGLLDAQVVGDDLRCGRGPP